MLGCELSTQLQLAPSVGFSEAWSGQGMLLQSMLIAERWLIEFLTGPVTFQDKQTLERRKRDGDICVDCFVYDWRLPAGQLANELHARKNVIDRLIAHPTWELVNAPPRQWTLTRVARCVEGLSSFAQAVRVEHASVASAFEARVELARQALQSGAPDPD